MSAESNVEIAFKENIDFPTDYQSILNRIARINPVKYASTRNFIDGAVTYLSPYISRGIISVKQVMDAMLQRGYEPYKIEKFLQELAWREYFQRVWQHVGDGISSDIKQPQPEVLHHEMITAIENAATGIDAIDDAVKHLYKTGYMHNHVRMYTASMACNMGKAHWLQPSKWMYYHLLDGDIASNNCSWQWVAAAFASKKYYFDQKNVNKYCSTTQRNTFVDKSYEAIVDMPMPDILTATSNLLLETKLPSTELPPIDTTKPTLIYNSYNLDVLWRKDEDVNRVLLLEPSHFERYPISEKVLQFIIDLSKNIGGIKIYTGEIEDISNCYKDSVLGKENCIISKEHPAFTHYPGIKDSREWMFPEVTGYYNSFFSFWKKCEKLSFKSSRISL
jgi:deoxyribodipyrimidine photo-lyase